MTRSKKLSKLSDQGTMADPDVEEHRGLLCSFFFLVYYEEPICKELANATKNQKKNKKIALEGSMMSVKVRTPSKRISKSSESEVSTSPYHVKANNSSSKLVTPKQDVKKKKRKRSPSTCLAYLAFSSHEGFIASVVNSLLGEEDDEVKTANPELEDVAGNVSLDDNRDNASEKITKGFQRMSLALRRLVETVTFE
ncbi:hypothetical protein LWI28_027218 [Acer negundo]|uniref:Uncharacterized protein n=1 Tax=Acer negundo TaxID=4023 RepID=A0AAD5IN88_ACENE|nr:hypothetical protein LWI28_027218 [Acer negundo]